MTIIWRAPCRARQRVKNRYNRTRYYHFWKWNPVVTLTRLDSTQPDFQVRLTQLLQFDDAADAAIEQTVAGILHDVKTRGDAAVLEYTERFDRLSAASLASLELSAAQLQTALEHLPADTRQALEAAAERVRRYHERQTQVSWTYTEDDGTVLGQKITPLDRVGLYVPGGKAAYPVVGADERDPGQGGRCG